VLDGFAVFLLIVLGLFAVIIIDILWRYLPPNETPPPLSPPPALPPPDILKALRSAPKHFRDDFMSKIMDDHIPIDQLRFHPALFGLTRQIAILAAVSNKATLDNRAHSVFQGDWKTVMEKYGLEHKKVLEDDRGNNRLGAYPANLKGLVTYISGKLNHIEQTASIAKVPATREAVFEFLVLPFPQLMLSIYDLYGESA
jgi:hypothetical protein